MSDRVTNIDVVTTGSNDGVDNTFNITVDVKFENLPFFTGERFLKSVRDMLRNEVHEAAAKAAENFSESMLTIKG